MWVCVSVQVCTCVAEGVCEGVNAFMGVNACEDECVCEGVCAKMCQQRVTGCEGTGVCTRVCVRLCVHMRGHMHWAEPSVVGPAGHPANPGAGRGAVGGRSDGFHCWWS